MLIGQLAALSGLSKDGIRHYEALGLIRSTPRQAGSRTYRDYDAKVLARIERVREGQAVGLPLREIGPLLDAFEAQAPEDHVVLQFLEDRLATIQARIADLQGVEAFLLTKLALHRAGALVVAPGPSVTPVAAFPKAAAHRPSLAPHPARSARGGGVGTGPCPCVPWRF